MSLPDDPLLVFGMGGSGTRMVVRGLESVGVFMGGRLTENKVAEPLVFPNEIHSFTDSFRYKLPLRSDWRTIVDERRHLVESFCVNRLPTMYVNAGYEGGPWGFKDPRTVFLAHLYLSLYPGARFVHVVRDPRDIADSKVKVSTLSLAYWMEVWANVVTVALTQCDLTSRSVTVRYEDLCICDADTMEKFGGQLSVSAESLRQAFQAIARSDRIGKRAGTQLPENVRTLAHGLGYQ